MMAVNYTQFRDHMKAHMDRIVEDYEPLVVTRKENKNVIVLSEDMYNNLMEDIHVPGNKENYRWLMESKQQLETGKSRMHELLEPDDE